MKMNRDMYKFCIANYNLVMCAGPLLHGFALGPIMPSDTMQRGGTGVEQRLASNLFLFSLS